MKRAVLAGVTVAAAIAAASAGWIGVRGHLPDSEEYLAKGVVPRIASWILRHGNPERRVELIRSDVIVHQESSGAKSDAGQ